MILIMAKNKQCIIHLYTGDGSGKTTAALGVALRSAGHKRKVIVVQFMKGRKNIGEYKIMERLKPEYEIHQFGREEWVDIEKPSEDDKNLAAKGIEFLRKITERMENIPDLLIIDEINLAAAIGLVRIDEVLDILCLIPKSVHVYLTGRNAPKEFIDIADYVTELNNIKHPQKIECTEGIEY